MGSLSNLYISQSYQSLIHLGSDTTIGGTLTELQDGLGNGIGIYVNNEGDLTIDGVLKTINGLNITGSVTINTEVTASTPSYVNSGNYYTDYIIRITGSFASGSAGNPTINEVQPGWIVNGNGIDNAIVLNKQYVNANFVEVTINQDTAVWFGDYFFSDPNKQYKNFSVSGSQDITGSLWVRDKITATDISASNSISASNLWVKDKIHAYELDVTIVSSSIVFTSGSNIIGDNANQDVQLLIGRTIVTGSLEVTSSIKATSDISSSTLNGIGNVTLYSQSVDNRLDLLENFSSSQYKADSASFQSQITTNSASFAAYSSSLVSTFATNAFVLANTASLSASIYLTDATQSNNISALSSSNAFSHGTFATTGSNVFVGNQIITGSLILSSSAEVELSVIGNSTFSGSVRGVVLPLTITSQTASIDCSLANFFTLTLAGSTTTHLTATNIRAGETISLKILQPTGSFGNVTYSSTLKFPANFPYVATPSASAVDIISLVSYDDTALYANSVNTLR